MTIDSGTCGPNLTWTFTDDYNLVIEGTGEMNDYSAGTSPWNQYRSQIQNITVSTGVTNIGTYAFYKCNFYTASFANTVVSIGSFAFAEASMSSITIPGTVLTIGDSAFISCASLVYVTIEEGVISIGASAFQGCSALPSISIPSTVTSIGRLAFDNGSRPSALISISVNENNLNYSSDGGVLFDKDKTELIRYPPAKDGTAYTIPSGVETIQTYAFSNASISAVSFPDTVQTIGSSAFQICAHLTEVTIPDGVATIGDHAFTLCIALTSFTVSGGVSDIGVAVCSDCSSLTNIRLGPEIGSIGAYAFSGCISTQQIILDAVPDEIGSFAFSMGSEEHPVTCTVLSPRNIAYGALDPYKGSNTILGYAPLVPPTTYDYLKIGNTKIQVDSAIRDGNGSRIDTHYSRSDLTNLTLEGTPAHGDTIVWSAQESKWVYGTPSGVSGVRDVQINGESIVTNNIAIIPVTATKVRLAELG